MACRWGSFKGLCSYVGIELTFVLNNAESAGKENGTLNPRILLKIIQASSTSSGK